MQLTGLFKPLICLLLGFSYANGSAGFLTALGEETSLFDTVDFSLEDDVAWPILMRRETALPREPCVLGQFSQPPTWEEIKCINHCGLKRKPSANVKVCANAGVMAPVHRVLSGREYSTDYVTTNNMRP